MKKWLILVVLSVLASIAIAEIRVKVKAVKADSDAQKMIVTLEVVKYAYFGDTQIVTVLDKKNLKVSKNKSAYAKLKTEADKLISQYAAEDTEFQIKPGYEFKE